MFHANFFLKMILLVVGITLALTSDINQHPHKDKNAKGKHHSKKHSHNKKGKKQYHNQKSGIQQYINPNFSNIQVIQSFRFQPQIQQYSIVKQIYPVQIFKKNRDAMNVIKQLKQKWIIEQNKQISKTNQNLNNLNNQIAKFMEKQHQNNYPPPQNQKAIAPKKQNTPIQSYQKPNKQEDKKKNNLIQEIKKQLMQKQMLRKEKQKRDQERKKEEEDIRRFDQIQKQKLKMQAEERQRKNKQIQKQLAAQQEQNQRKKKINQQRLQRQQDMQIKNLEIGFNPENGQSNLKYLAQMRKKRQEAQRREDQALLKQQQLAVLKLKGKGSSQEKIQPNLFSKFNENKEQKDIKTIQSNRFKELAQSKMQQPNIALKKKFKEKELIQSQFPTKMEVQNSLLQNGKKNQAIHADKSNFEIQFGRHEVNKTQQVFPKQQKQSKQANKPIKQQKNIGEKQKLNSLSAVNSQLLNSSIKQQEQAKADDVKIIKSLKPPQSIEVIPSKQQSKQEIIKRIKQYQLEKSTKISKQMPLKYPQTQIKTNSQQQNLPNPQIADTKQDANQKQHQQHLTSELAKFKNNQQDTDVFLQKQLEERIKNSIQTQNSVTKPQLSARKQKITNNHKTISQFVIYFIFVLLILVAICTGLQSIDHGSVIKLSNNSGQILRGSLLPQQELDD